MGILSLSVPSAEGGEAARGPMACRLTGLDGSRTTLSVYRNEVVVVSLWASWCGSCRTKLVMLDGWNNAWAARGGRVIAVSVDRDARRARRFVTDENLTMTVLHDESGEFAQTLGIRSLPCTLLLDRGGRVAAVAPNDSMSELTDLRRMAESLLRIPPGAAIQSAGMDVSPAANVTGE